MISIKANDQFLELSQPNPDMRIQVRSTFYGKITSLVVDLLIPNTPHNTKVLGHIDKPNRFNRTRQTIPVTLYSNNTFLFEGTATTNDIAEKNIDLMITFILDEVANALEDKMLNEVVDEEFAYDTDHFHDTMVLAWPETPYNFPSVYNPSFYGDKNPAFAGVINNCEGTFVDTTFNANTVVPFLYLPEIVNRLFAHAGYSVRGKIFDDEFFKRALVYNNYALDKLIAIYFSAGKELGELSSSIIDWDKTIIDSGQNYDQSTGKYEIKVSGEYSIKCSFDHTQTFNPETNDKYYVRVVHEANGVPTTIYENSDFLVEGAPYNIHIDFETQHQINTTTDDFLYISVFYIKYNSTVHLAEIVQNIVVPFVIINNLDNVNVNAYQSSFNLKNHVPDMECLDFLNKVFHDFQVFPVNDRQNKIVTLVSFKDYITAFPGRDYNDHLIKDTLRIQESDYRGLAFNFNFEGPDNLLQNNFYLPSDIEGISASIVNLATLAPNLVYLFEPLNAYMSKLYNEETTEFEWQVISDNQLVHKTDDGKDPVLLHFAPMLMRYVENSAEIPRLLPSIDAAGTSEAYNLRNDFPLRIMFYMQVGGTTPTEYYYPLAMTTNKKLFVEEIDPLLSRNWTPQDVAAMYWPEYIGWRKRRLPFKCRLFLNSTEMSKIDLSLIAYILNTTVSIEQMFIKMLPNGADSDIEGFTV
jgi:hypothetical protein